jgi:hypothetical protein
MLTVFSPFHQVINRYEQDYYYHLLNHFVSWLFFFSTFYMLLGRVLLAAIFIFQTIEVIHD